MCRTFCTFERPRGQVVLGAPVSPDAGGQSAGAMHAETLLNGVPADICIYAEESFGGG
ncbi:hypothetical protein [Tropicibacter sp. S64]|uniref:hypothetical protein n=1 Tax=Tropicibacter sp. S64 TaxID=3415122 RepID=UPI003C7A0AE7